MARGLRDFRRASFTPTQVASCVATAPFLAPSGPVGAIADADAAGESNGLERCGADEADEAEGAAKRGFQKTPKRGSVA